MRYHLEFSELAIQLTMIEDDKVGTSFVHQLTSLSDLLKEDEAKAFIKESTKSSFLHAADYSCFYRSTQFLLLPSAIYDENLLLQYHELNFGTSPNPSLLHADSLNKYGITSIYTLAAWVSNFCANNFPGKPIVPVHQAYLNQQQENSSHSISGCLCYDQNSFYLQLIQKGKLIYSQEIPIVSSDDILYFTTAALKNLPIDTYSGKVSIYPRQALEMDETIGSNFRRIQEFNDIQFVVSDFASYQNELLCE